MKFVEQFHLELYRIRLQYVSYTHITNMFRLIYIRFKMKNCSNKQNRVGKYIVKFQEFMHVNEKDITMSPIYSK